jgi:hypothetical protein
MQALYRSLLVTTLCAAVSVFMFDGVSHAKGGSKVKVEVRAELEPFDTSPEPDAEGKARHKNETKKGVLRKDEFKATVKVPVPSLALGITDEASAENAAVHLLVSGSTSADCLMEFDEFDDDDDELQAEFKLDVRWKKSTVQDKKGTCGESIPGAQDGDVATVTVNGTSILDGTFEVH